MMSLKPPIGSNYLKMMNYHRKNKVFYATLPGNVKVSLPRFYRDKFFTEREKELHRIEAEQENDKKEIDKYDQLTNKGENAESYFWQAREQALQRIKDKSKGSKL